MQHFWMTTFFFPLIGHADSIFYFTIFFNKLSKINLMSFNESFSCQQKHFNILMQFSFLLPE